MKIYQYISAHISIKRINKFMLESMHKMMNSIDEYYNFHIILRYCSFPGKQEVREVALRLSLFPYL